MTNQVYAKLGGLLVGDYADEAACPSNPQSHGGEVIRPHVVGNYADLWANDEGLREFTVLLKDGRVVAVRGHSLKHEPHPVAGEDVFSIAIRTTTEDVLVALFKGADVAGIFHGDLRADRKIA